MVEKRPLRLGVIGCGHWGPNHLRVFSELDRSEVLACADTNESRLAQIRQRFPRVSTTADYHDLLDNEEIDAVVIATPTDTHARIAKDALIAGKHVLVEKPICRTSAEASELLTIAESAKRVLMVGHVFVFNNGIRKLKELIQSGELGQIHYLDAIRTNLGPVRGDVNALFDLGTHDITIFNYLLDSTPVEVSAMGRCISQQSIEDVCFATLRYADGTLAHIHVSWMNPRKIRSVTAIGERKMAHWDDVNPDHTLMIYNKGFEEPPYYDSFGEFHYILRNADVHLPAIRRTEPLVNQAEAFLDWVIDGTPCNADAVEGLRVANVLEAATKSIQNNGAFCDVESVSTLVCKEATLPANQVCAPNSDATALKVSRDTHKATS